MTAKRVRADIHKQMSDCVSVTDPETGKVIAYLPVDDSLTPEQEAKRQKDAIAEWKKEIPGVREYVGNGIFKTQL